MLPPNTWKWIRFSANGGYGMRLEVTRADIRAGIETRYEGTFSSLDTVARRLS